MVLNIVMLTYDDLEKDILEIIWSKEPKERIFLSAFSEAIFDEIKEMFTGRQKLLFQSISALNSNSSEIEKIKMKNELEEDLNSVIDQFGSNSERIYILNFLYSVYEIFCDYDTIELDHLTKQSDIIEGFFCAYENVSRNPEQILTALKKVVASPRN